MFILSEHLLTLLEKNWNSRVSMYNSKGEGVNLSLTSFFRGVLLFMTDCDTGGGGVLKMVIFA